MKLSEYLRTHRVTQEAFAKRLEVTQGYVSKLLRGQQPSLAMALKIAEATNGAVQPCEWAGRDSGAAETGSEAAA